MRTIVHTLGYNVPDMVAETAALTVGMNEDAPFEYLIAHLGFPLSEFHEQEVTKESIINAKLNNGVAIREIAASLNAQVSTLKNLGVSPNWEQVRKLMNVGVNDVLICADPDERPQQDNWVHAISEVIAADPRIAWCSLMMKEQEPLLASGRFRYTEKKIAGHRVYIMHDVMNWAQGGFSGRFLDQIGGVPAMDRAPIYGWIEGAATEQFGIRWDWCILADFYVEHIASPPLYGEWKQWVTSDQVIRNNEQIGFEQWLLKYKVNEA